MAVYRWGLVGFLCAALLGAASGCQGPRYSAVELEDINAGGTMVVQRGQARGVAPTPDTPPGLFIGTGPGEFDLVAFLGDPAPDLSTPAEGAVAEGADIFRGTAGGRATSGGATLQRLQTRLNASGDLAALALLGGPGVSATRANDRAVYTRSAGADGVEGLRLVLRRGERAPAVSGGEPVASIDSVAVDDQGRAIVGVTFGYPKRQHRRTAIVRGLAGSDLQLIAFEGQLAPGLTSVMDRGRVFGHIDPPVVAPSGVIAVRAELEAIPPYGVARSLLYRYTADDRFELVAGEGDSMPPGMGGGVLGEPRRYSVASDGTIAFLAPQGGASNRSPVFIARPGHRPQVVVRPGDRLRDAGRGWSWVGMSRDDALVPAVSPDGRVAVVARLSRPGGAARRSSRGRGESVEGGRGGRGGSVNTGPLGEALSGGVGSGGDQRDASAGVGGGVSGNHGSRGLFVFGPDGSVLTVATTARAAPGVPTGFRYDGFGQPALLPGGGVVFTATINRAKPSVPQLHDRGLFIYRPGDGVRLLAMEGQGLDVVGMEDRRVNRVLMLTGHGRGAIRPTWATDSGIVGFSVEFDDGGTGIFTTSMTSTAVEPIEVTGVGGTGPGAVSADRPAQGGESRANRPGRVGRTSPLNFPGRSVGPGP